MTVIVAARTQRDGIAMACDSLTTAGWLKEYNDTSKIWAADDTYLIGGAGCVRTTQVIRHFTTWPKWRPDEDTDIPAFVIKRIVPAIRTACEGAGVTRSKEGIESIRSELIIAWGDNLATVSGNGAVIIPRDHYTATGSGYAEALGALGEKGPWTKAQVIEVARRATITAVGCDGPIKYATTKDLAVEVV